MLADVTLRHRLAVRFNNEKLVNRKKFKMAFNFMGLQLQIRILFNLRYSLLAQPADIILRGLAS
jgi:hypothetical protein